MNVSGLQELLSRHKGLFILFLISTIVTFFYTYTQVDLSLTLSRASVLQTIEKSFQYVGYFNRPLSTALFLLMLALQISTYMLIVKALLVGKLSKRAIWTMILIMTIVLTFSYNAFSYDFFNYIFDAKILTHYHLNPYSYKALDFPGDPMLSFMHWTHRTYPYGPLWLLVTIPFSFIGANVFVPTFFLFKFLISLSFVGLIYSISRIMKHIAPEREIPVTALIAFHPLLISEFLVSSHNDVFMIFLVFLGILLIIHGKIFGGILFYLASIGTKFATVFMLPAYAFLFYAKKRKISGAWSLFFLISGIFLLIAAIAASRQTNFQPWYLTWALPFFLMLPFGGYAKAAQLVGAFSAAAVLLYVPFLYHGDWEYAVPTNFLILLWSIIVLFYMVFFIRKVLREKEIPSE